MALYAVSIEKQTLFHGKQELFNNTYFYEGPTFQAGDANYKGLVDDLAAAEKLVHGPEVEFMQGRIWSSGGTILQNVTLGLFDLDGFGTLGGGSPMHAEAAVMVEWECSRANILGRKVYLRKYIRSQLGGNTADVPFARGKGPIGVNAAALYKTYANSVQKVARVAGPEFLLCSPTGRLPRNDNNGVADPFIRTREFRRN